MVDRSPEAIRAMKATPLAIMLVLGAMAAITLVQPTRSNLSPAAAAAAETARMAAIGRCRALLRGVAPALSTGDATQDCLTCSALVRPGRDGVRSYLGDPRSDADLARERRLFREARQSLAARDPLLADAFAARAKAPFDFQHDVDDFTVAERASAYCLALN